MFKTDVVILVYDITSQYSFQGILGWINYLKKIDFDVDTILIGNKADLEEQREISQEEGKKLAQENGFYFLETSALTGVNVSETLTLATKLALLKKLSQGIIKEKCPPASQMRKNSYCPIF
mmetsp:Transcript_11989/g.10586  ORF Transcript_11989/g.10586 Transcript_11989/m.10586 type:complete len:121 (-) Transcript_11989:43-405(-)